MSSRTFRISKPVADASMELLSQMRSSYHAVLESLLMEALLDQNRYVLHVDKLTLQNIANELWSIKVREGDFIVFGEVTIDRIIRQWDDATICGQKH